jgi:hypothetical protein
MRIVVLGASAALAGFAVADAGEPEILPWLNGAAAVGFFSESGPARSAPAARLSAGVEAGWLLDGGWTFGGVVGGSIEADARRSGALGPCQRAGCAGAGARVSPLSRLTDASEPRGPTSRTVLDRAYLFARGP